MKAFILCRNSTEEQEKKGTIQSQVEYANKYLELHGPEMGITEHEFYIDEGVSGTIALKDRPAGAKLLRDIKQTKSGILLVYRLDRLARSVKHVLDTYDYLTAYNVGLRSMTESFDTTTPTGKFFMTLLASIAALEKDTIMERTQMGKQRGISEGRWVNGHIPFGYKRNEKGYLEVEESEAKVIRDIFRLYLDGMTMRELAKYLNSLNIPVGSAKTVQRSKPAQWAAGTLSTMLSSEYYIGKYKALSRSEKESVPFSIPVIIDEETFYRVQELKQKNFKVRSKKGRFYPLRRLVKCAECGCYLVGTVGGTPNARRYYYRCCGFEDIGNGKRCTKGNRMRADVLEPAVWEATKEVIKNPTAYKQRLEEKLKEVTNNEPKSVQDELNKIEIAIEEKQTSRGKIISLVTRNLISDREAEQELGQLADDIKTLTHRRESLFEAQEKALSYEKEILSVSSALEKWREIIDSDLTPEQMAEILNTFVREVVVSNEEKESTVTIYFKGLMLPYSAEGQQQTIFVDINESIQIENKRRSRQ